MKVVALNWRDLTHPEGGGSERYIEEICAGLVARGHHVTLVCADHGRAPRDEIKRGVHYIRRGSKMSVYPAALRLLLDGTVGSPDVVIDVSNGIPFFSPLVRKGPIVGVVHHVHREQWPVVMGSIGARVGWFLESRVAPRVFKGRPMVAVSAATRSEMIELGYSSATTVIHNGTDKPVIEPEHPRAARPTLCVLGRLVPQKQVSHAIEAVARLRQQVPDLQLWIVGSGWDEIALRDHASALGVDDVVEFTGFVSQAEKHRRLSQAWVHLCPSLKEGWGLSVMEAAWHGVPTVAYENAGGLSESIVHDHTGVLVPKQMNAFVDAVQELLTNDSYRQQLGDQARVHAHNFTWEATTIAFEQALLDAIRTTS